MIDLVPKLKELSQGFPIGHSSSQSETFLPLFIGEKDGDSTLNPNTEDITWVDLPGSDDTNGELVQFINTFTQAHIFHLSLSITFLIPFTVAQITQNRGESIKKLI